MYSQECDECSHKWECHGVKLDCPQVTLTIFFLGGFSFRDVEVYSIQCALAIDQVGWSIASVGLVNPSLNECQGDNASFNSKGK